jgi:hypothetical protein
VFNVTVSSKTYVATGAINPPPPPPPYDAPTNENNYHFSGHGTFDTNNGHLDVLIQVSGQDCVNAAPIYYEIRVYDVVFNNNNPVGDTAYGKFRLNAWLGNTTCANPPVPPYITGDESSIDSQPIGTNFKVTGLAANADSDAPASPGGDGCSNVDELQTAAGTEDFGGRRDPHNPYDFFDPVPGPSTKRQVLVPDILAVVQKYFKGSMDPLPDGGGLLSPDLKSKYDRTYLGPNVWNLGPPDGLQRVPDILAVVKQYFDSCANA